MRYQLAAFLVFINYFYKKSLLFKQRRKKTTCTTGPYNDDSLGFGMGGCKLAFKIMNDVLAANPEIADILNKVSATLTTENVTALNAAVDVDKREYDEVAREYYDSIK